MIHNSMLFIRKNSAVAVFALLVLFAFMACTEQKEHVAPAVNPRDSVPMMVSYGVNTMISDSGVMRYRIVAERWEVNENLEPKRWIFRRGFFMTQFDEKFHVETYVQSDTAYYFTEARLWHLVGNVRVKTVDGLRFNSEELYWDQNRHELYSNLYSHVVTPERELEGNYFTSDEGMKHYTVLQSKGNFTREDAEGKKDEKKPEATPDGEQENPKRAPAMPLRR